MTLTNKDGLFYVQCSIEETITLSRPNGFLNFKELKEIVDEEGEWHLNAENSFFVVTPKLAQVLANSRDTHPTERQLRALLYKELTQVKVAA